MIDFVIASMLTGLARKGNPPNCCVDSFCDTMAVRKTIGTVAREGSERICWATSPPSIFGMTTSQKDDIRLPLAGGEPGLVALIDLFHHEAPGALQREFDQPGKAAFVIDEQNTFFGVHKESQRLGT